MIADATCENMSKEEKNKFIKDATERCKANIPIEQMIDWAQLITNARRKKSKSSEVDKKEAKIASLNEEIAALKAELHASRK